MTAESDLKDAMLKRVEETYSDLMQFVAALDKETIVNRPGHGEWSIQDILAHVAAWEGILLRFHLSGEAFEDVIGVSGVQYRVTPFDEINQHLLEMYRDWTLEEVTEFSERTHSELLERLAQFSDDDLLAPLSTLMALGLEAHPVTTYIAANTYEHYLEHLEDVRRKAA